jgi:hypothetical protein
LTVPSAISGENIHSEATAILASATTARRIIDEGVGYGLALEGISAAEVARAK